MRRPAYNHLAFAISLLLFIGSVGHILPLETSGSFENGLTVNSMTIVETGQFIRNEGQWDDKILFTSDTSFGRVIFFEDHVLYDVQTEERGIVVSLDFPGSSGSNPEGMGAVGTTYNYFIGNDPDKWVSGAPSFEKVMFEDLWPGVDMVYRFADGQLKYDILLDPGVDPSVIGLQFGGPVSIEVKERSVELELENGLSLMDDRLTVNYVDGDKEIIDARYMMDINGIVRFQIEEHDLERSIIIDPLVYSTFIGGGAWDQCRGLISDEDGNVIGIGFGDSIDMPTGTGTYQMEKDGWIDAYIFKLDPTGSNLVFCTYFGGDQRDYFYDLRIHSSGDIIVGGTTESDDIPTTENAYDRIHGGGWDLLSARFDGQGSSLIYSTYIGGMDDDIVSAMEFTSNGSVALIGKSLSSNFPTTDDAFDNVLNGSDDAVISILSPDGRTLEYSTYFGGILTERARGISLDPSGNIFITGYTSSSDLPTTTSGYDLSFNGNADVFVAGFSPNGTELVYSTYIGGTGIEEAWDIDIDPNGDIYVVGATEGSGFPISPGAWDTVFDGYKDGFSLSLTPGATILNYCTLIGGSHVDDLYEMEVDRGGNVYIAAGIASTDMEVTPNAPYPNHAGGVFDGAVIVLQKNGSRPILSTFIGGTGSFDYIYGICLGDDGEIFLGGNTGSSDFPTTTGAYDTVHGGIEDIIIASMTIDLDLPTTPPRNLTAIAGSDFVEVSWDEPEKDGGQPVLDYMIYRVQEGTAPAIMEEKVAGTTYNDTDLDKGFSYKYFVKARNSIGLSGPSKTESAMPASVPSQPRDIIGLQEDDMLEVKWQAPFDNGGLEIMGYEVSILDDGSTIGTYSVIPSATNITIGPLQYGVMYTVLVRAENGFGISPPSDPMEIMLRTVPQPPINFTAEGFDSKVVLSWQKPSFDGGYPLTSYRIYKGSSSGSEGLLKTVSALRSEYEDTDVVNGESYSYSISAFNQLGESDLTESIQGIPKAVPGIPRNFEAVPQDSSILLKWRPPSDDGGSQLTGYVLSKLDENNEPITEINIDIQLISYIDEGLENGQIQNYRLTVLNDVGHSFPTTTITVAPRTIPGMLISVSVEEGNGYNFIEWEQPQNDGGAQIEGFIVYRGTVDGKVNYLTSLGPDVIHFNDTGLINGRSYHYAVTAFNVAGESAISDHVLGIPGTVPSPPKNVSVVQGSGFLEVFWEHPDENGGRNIDEFSIERSENNIDFQEISKVGSGQYRYRDEDIGTGTEYSYRIRSINEMGLSIPSSKVSKALLTSPSQPMITVIGKENGGIKIEWTAPEDTGGSSIISYRIFRSIDEEVPVLIGEVGPLVLSYVDAGAIGGSTYSYYITASNEAFSSSYGIGKEYEIPGGEEEGGSALLVIGLIVLFILLISLVITMIIFRSGSKDYNEEKDMGTGTEEIEDKPGEAMGPFGSGVNSVQGTEQQYTPENVNGFPQPPIMNEEIPINDDPHQEVV